MKKYLFVLLTIHTVDSEYGSVFWKEIDDTDNPEKVVRKIIKDNFYNDVTSEDGYTIFDTKEEVVKKVIDYTEG